MSADKHGEDQYARFVETARKLGCDESEEAFDEKLKVIARQKPKAAPQASKASVPRSHKPRR